MPLPLDTSSSPMHDHPALARTAIRNLRASPIREVANAGMGRSGILRFWFGEPDEVTPAFIRQA
ncbi:MAG: pyridoxal phosphate-dependent aminotransferase, partial [Betaproteobacteria bacterium]